MSRLDAKRLIWIGVGLLVGGALVSYASLGTMRVPTGSLLFQIAFMGSSILSSIMLVAQFVGAAMLAAGLVIGAHFLPKLAGKLLKVGVCLLLGAFALYLIATSLMNYLTQGGQAQEVVIEIWPFVNPLIWLALFAGAAALTAGLVLGASPQDDAGTGLAGRQHLGSEPSRPESDPSTGD